MPRIEDFDSKSPPFDQFKGLQPLGEDRRGHVSAETARHRLYVGTDKRTNTSALIKVTSRPGLTYQHNLENEIAALKKRSEKRQMAVERWAKRNSVKARNLADRIQLEKDERGDV